MKGGIVKNAQPKLYHRETVLPRKQAEKLFAIISKTISKD
jgi:hypothetical protein